MKTPTRIPLLLAAGLAATMVLTGCSGGGSEPGDSGAAPMSTSADEAGPPGGAEGASSEDAYRATAETASTNGDSEGRTADLTTGFERAVIATGMVSLLDDDVAGARFDVQKVVDAHGGEVAEEKTQTDDDGDVSRSRLVVRVPVGEFDATMEELEGVARLESSSRSTEDVTTEVIDTEVRIRAQSKSLERVEVLLARARSIRDIVAIEAQLTRRQGELDSLKARQAYLADQTSMSTISVFLEEPPARSRVTQDKDSSGFLAGLGAGWGGLKDFLVGAATVVGAVLPFTVLLVLVGVPLWLLGRSRWAARLIRRGGSGRTPSAA